MSEQNKRFIEIDIFKGICILAVIAIHMSGIIAPGGKLSIYKLDDYFLYSIITRFCVPGFILASGLVLSLRGKTIKIKDFLKNRLCFIVIPYIFWSLFYSFFWTKLNGQPINPFKAIIYGTASYHLYFILIILQYYVVFLCLNKYIKFIRPLHLVILFCAQLFVNEFSNKIQLKLGNFNFVTTFIPWIFIYTFGCYVGRNYEACRAIFIKFRGIIFAGTVLSLLYQLSRFLQMYFSGVDPRKIPNGTVIVLTVFVFALVLSYSDKYDNYKNTIVIKFLNRIGLISFGIYLIHPILLPFFVIKINPIFNNDISSYLILAEYIVTVLISWGLIELLRKVKFSKYIIGR